MGLYDRVIVICPKCGGPLEFQSHAGECYDMEIFPISAVPVGVAYDLDGNVNECDCGAKVKISTKNKIRFTEEMFIEVIKP